MAVPQTKAQQASSPGKQGRETGATDSSNSEKRRQLSISCSAMLVPGNKAANCCVHPLNYLNDDCPQTRARWQWIAVRKARCLKENVMVCCLFGST